MYKIFWLFCFSNLKAVQSEPDYTAYQQYGGRAAVDKILESKKLPPITLWKMKGALADSYKTKTNSMMFRNLHNAGDQLLKDLTQTLLDGFVHSIVYQTLQVKMI